MKETSSEKNLREVLGNRIWKELNPKGRQDLVKKYEADYDRETRTIKETIKLLRQYHFNLGLLVMGIVLGMVGSFLVSAIDRLELLYFGQDSYGYNIGVIIVCVTILCLVIRQFNKLNKDILLSNKDTASYFNKE